MEEGRGIFDLTAYMMFEASGDSDQAGYCDGALMTAESGEAEDEDDAQSCSYGSSGIHDISDQPPVVGGGEVDRPDFDSYCDMREDWDQWEEEEMWRGDYEEEEGVVNQYCGRRKPPSASAESNSAVAPEKIKEKLKKSNKGCEEMMNERERDRLFWEACLAS